MKYRHQKEAKILLSDKIGNEKRARIEEAFQSEDGEIMKSQYPISKTNF